MEDERNIVRRRHGGYVELDIPISAPVVNIWQYLDHSRIGFADLDIATIPSCSFSKSG